MLLILANKTRKCTSQTITSVSHKTTTGYIGNIYYNKGMHIKRTIFQNKVST